MAYLDIVRGKTRAVNNTGMTWETSVTESAKAVGVTNESPFLVDLWSYAPRCYDVATYLSAGPGVSGDLGGYRSLGVPMTQMIQSGTFYHSSGDVPRRCRPKAWIARRGSTRFYRQADQGARESYHRRQGTRSQPRQPLFDRVGRRYEEGPGVNDIRRAHPSTSSG